MVELKACVKMEGKSLVLTEEERDYALILSQFLKDPRKCEEVGIVDI